MKVNSEDPSIGPINSVQFHRNGQLLLTYVFDLVKAGVEKVGSLMGRDEKSLELFEVSPDSSTIAFVGNQGFILLLEKFFDTSNVSECRALYK
ncbi:hypothetical protein KSP39_PZI003348 [Platanthera zijinensis]|uniref:Uncharacterized protein n=1 Tax=Platanthera zijinensis TaxID=2320716 RepID=A0AAP0BX39_9ASPA